jgi:hypothetical protein
MKNNQLINDKLNQIKDSPDDFVWNNIEKKLDKKKKRRFFIFWLFFISLSSVMGVYLLNNLGGNSNSSPVNNSDSNSFSVENTSKVNDLNTNNSQINAKIIQDSESKNDNSNSSTLGKKEEKEDLRNSKYSNVNNYNTINSNNKLSASKTNSFSKKKNQKKYSQKPEKDGVSKNNEAIASEESSLNNNLNNEIINATPEITAVVENKKIILDKKKLKKQKDLETDKKLETNLDTVVDREGRRFVIIPFVGFGNMAFNNDYSLLSNDAAYKKQISEINIQFGVRTRVELADDVSFSFGFSYNKYSSTSFIDYKPDFEWDNNINNSLNIPFTSNLLEVKQDLVYISIPINVEYPIYESKNTHIKTFLGPEFSYLETNKILYKSNNDWIEFAEASFLNKGVVNLRTGFIVRQNLTKNWVIELNPELKIPFYMKRQDYFAKPYFYGFTIGTEFKF